MNKNINTYKKLFLSTFALSAFTFGGGYVIVPLMKSKFVDELHWLEEKEMLDFIAIAQSSPGAIAINTCILLGYRVAGVLGALIAIMGTVLPPLIIISVISLFYSAFKENHLVAAVLKGMNAGVAAVIANVVINMGSNVVKERDSISIVIMAFAFTAAYFLKINIIYIILICAAIGALRIMLAKKTEVGGTAK